MNGSLLKCLRALRLRADLDMCNKGGATAGPHSEGVPFEMCPEYDRALRGSDKVS